MGKKVDSAESDRVSTVKEAAEEGGSGTTESSSSLSASAEEENSEEKADEESAAEVQELDKLKTSRSSRRTEVAVIGLHVNNETNFYKKFDTTVITVEESYAEDQSSVGTTSSSTSSTSTGETRVWRAPPRRRVWHLAW